MERRTHKRIISAVLVVLLMVTFGCAKEAEENKGLLNENHSIEINPLSEASAANATQVNMYYKYSFTNMLAGEIAYLSVPVNEKIEKAVLQVLINGPSEKNSEFIAIINPETEIVSISGKGNTLNVTFSKNFLDFIIPEGTTTPESKKIKQLAIFSVVDTLIEVSNYSRIQILVDKNGSGKGERISLYEAGFDEEGFLEPLGYNTDIMLTPENTMIAIFNAMTRKDYEELYFYIAYKDSDSSVKMDESVFVSRMYEQMPSLEGYTAAECVISPNGQYAYVITDYNLRVSGEVREYENTPVKLVRENDTWKIQYTRFETLFLGL